MGDISYTGELLLVEKGKPTKIITHLIVGGLQDYSALSTIVGWVSYTVKVIEYVKIGKLVTVWFTISGVSDATGASFTLPFASANTLSVQFSIRTLDNSVTWATGLGALASGASLVNLYPSAAGGNWTAANDKYAYGQFSYFASE